MNDEKNPINPSEFSAAFNAGKEQIVANEFNGVPFFVVPNGMKIETLEKLDEKFRDAPIRLKQRITLLSAESFIDYFSRFGTNDSTIFIDIEDSKFTAVLDYHIDELSPRWCEHVAIYNILLLPWPQLRRWCEHVAIYNCPKTKEWSSWLDHNNEKMKQEDFAMFLEDNIKEIIEPAGADLLEMVSTLKAKKDVDFKSGIRLANGEVQFNYQETIDGQAGINGQFSIPEEFTLALKPFLSGAPYEVKARFRYRIGPGGLVMWYTLIRPHIIQQDATNEVIEQVKKSITQGQVLHATVNF